MIRPASSALRRIGIGLVVLFALVCGVAALRILFGPVSLGALTPIVEAALNRGLSEHRVTIGGSVLRWSRDEGLIDLRFVDVALKSRDGMLLAQVPEMELGLSAKALMRGVIAPAEVAIFRPAATIVRRTDGRIQLGFSKDSEEGVVQGSDRFFSVLLAILRDAPHEQSPSGYLERFIIRDGTLTFYDRITRSLWRAPNAVLSFARGSKGLDARLDAAMVSGEKSFVLTARGTLERAADLFRVTAELKGLVPAVIAEESAALAPFKGVAAPLMGTIAATFTSRGVVKAGSFQLTMGEGHVTMPGFSALALDIKSAEATGHYDAATDSIILERLAYDAGANKAQATGTLGFVPGEGGAITGLTFALGARAVSLNLPKLFSRPGKIETVTLNGRLSFAGRKLTLENAVLASGAARLSLEGEILDAPAAPAVRLEGRIESLPFADLGKLWPIGSAEGARDWIVANVPRGIITEGSLLVDAAGGVLALPRIPDEAVKLAFSFQDIELNYIRGLAPITGGSGHAVLWGNRFELWLDQGRIDELSVSEGTFVVPDLGAAVESGDVSARLTGKTASLLRVLDMQPLGYPTQYGVDPSSVGGSVDARLTVHVPLLNAVSWEEIGFKTQAQVMDLSLPAPYRDFAFSRGALDVAVNEEGLEAKGDVLVGGYPSTLNWRESFATGEAWPTAFSLRTTLDSSGLARAVHALGRYVEGLTPLEVALKGKGVKVKAVDLKADLAQAALALPELNYRKAKGVPGTLSLTLALEEEGRLDISGLALKARGLDIGGRLSFAPDGSLLSAELNPLRAGTGSQATVHAKRTDAGALALTIKGKALDLSQAMDTLSGEWRAPHGEAKTPLSLDVTLDRLELAHGVVMNDAALHLSRGREKLTELSLAGALNGTSKAAAELTRDLAHRRHLKVEAEDAGAFLAGLALTDNVVGGKLKLDITLPEASAPTTEMPGSGTLRMDNFRVVRAPALAKLFAVGSLSGMGDLLNGEGIAFERLEAPFTLINGTIKVGRSQAYGPAVGLTLQGEIPRAEGEMDLTGTLVPSYTLNTLLGYVPIFGTLLTSRSGEGILGFTYAVSGEPSDPRVFVNPLSAFTPGVLRRIFQIDEGVEARERAEPQEKPVIPQ